MSSEASKSPGGALLDRAVARYHEILAEGDTASRSIETMREGFEPETERREWQRLDEIPFDARHRLMATLNRVPYGESVILVKGAPERLLDLCAEEAGDGGPIPIDRARWADQIADAAADGERVLGFAMKHCAADRHDRTSRTADDGPGGSNPDDGCRGSYCDVRPAGLRWRRGRTQLLVVGSEPPGPG